ncbi:MAG: PilZ domain-containing protein [Proteobacteria bacterium]|nr:PilZ domain-containing protein [Pseudomonadota bacterium]
MQVTRDSEVYILSTLNVSRGGLFVQCAPAEAPDLLLGREVEVLIFAPEEAIEDVGGQARVARIDDGSAPGHLAGVGLRFTQLDAENTRRLERLIGLS